MAPDESIDSKMEPQQSLNDGSVQLEVRQVNEEQDVLVDGDDVWNIVQSVAPLTGEVPMSSGAKRLLEALEKGERVPRKRARTEDEVQALSLLQNLFACIVTSDKRLRPLETAERKNDEEQAKPEEIMSLRTIVSRIAALEEEVKKSKEVPENLQQKQDAKTTSSGKPKGMDVALHWSNFQYDLPSLLLAIERQESLKQCMLEKDG